MGLFKRKESHTVIDLVEAEQQRRMAERAAPARRWGLPEPCPACGDPGYLDRIDIEHEVMFQHCPTCFHKWETTKDEAEAASA